MPAWKDDAELFDLCRRELFPAPPWAGLPGEGLASR